MVRIVRRRRGQEPSQPAPPNEPTRLALVGSRASGKSTCIGLLNLTAMDLTDDPYINPDQRGLLDTTSGMRLVRSSIDEMSSSVRSIMSDLQDMRFPPPTPPDQAFQSKLTLEFEWKRLIGVRRRTVELTITDSAGETLSQLMENAEHGNFSLRLDMRQIDEINKFVLSSSAFVVLVDMEAVMGKGEDTDISDSTTDARLARFVDYLHRWKENDPTSPQIKSVALLGTKYDTVRGEILDNPGFGSKDMYGHLGDPRNAAIFLYNHLPQTNQNLKQLFHTNDIMDHLQVFHSSVDLVPDQSEFDEKRIQQVQNIKRPSYSKEQYKQLIKWMGTLAE